MSEVWVPVRFSYALCGPCGALLDNTVHYCAACLLIILGQKVQGLLIGISFHAGD